MKLSQLLSSEVKTAMRNIALDCEAGRYAQKVKEVRRERSNSAAAGKYNPRRFRYGSKNKA